MANKVSLVDPVILQVGLPLRAQRNLKSSLLGLWKFLGDKVEPSETPLEREIRDELVADVRVADCVEAVVHEYPFGAGALTTFYCDVTLPKRDSIVWLPPSELAILDSVPTGVPTVQTLPGLLAAPSDPSSRLTLIGRERP